MTSRNYEASPGGEAAPAEKPRAAPAAPDLLHLRHVAKHYGAVAAVDDVSLAIRNGEFLTLLGPSGSGKTTLLMMLAGFVTASAGEILLDGADIAPLLPEKRNFGMVFQGYALFPHLSVFDNVAFPLSVRRERTEVIRRKVEAALDLVDMTGLADRLPKMLSGGQQQRVALARAIVFDPKVLLLDEPLGALDRQLRASLQEELKVLHQRLGTTFICVTHDQEEAMSMSDRVVVMRAGRIVQTGAPAEIYRRPVSRFVANFLGESNILKGRCLMRDGAANIVELAGRRLRVGGAGDAGDAFIALRPEHVTLDDRADAATDDGLALSGRVSGITFVGTDYRVRLETGLGSLIARLRASDAIAERLHPGLAVTVRSPAAALWRVNDD
ncbi:MAG: ABC transporter ATP-binding protein [Pseudomonadota bacterium]